ncbi:MAG: helix-turn-helix domain-containing protein [candidate division Zixibacteria bacterium]|nr:helix-turn-helix domain-containing protein [candidate division Zixibacteria bacterium]
MNMPNYEEMVEAMRASDADYDGRFFVGVHSTGIYCLPSCPARLPLLKNVVFYVCREEAVAAGLRGCKRCHSDRYPDTLPEWLHTVLKQMSRTCDMKHNEGKLAEITGVEISTVRRHFRKHLGTTPSAFHRRLRLNYARSLIEEGNGYLEAAFATGWESSSGFRDAFRREFGFPPGRFYARP